MTALTGPRGAGLSIVLLLAWIALWLGLAGEPTLSVLAYVLLAWLPLAPAVPLVFRGSTRAAGWCSLAGVFYAGFAMMEMVANPAARWWATVTLVLSVAMIGMLSRMIRAGRPQAR